MIHVCLCADSNFVAPLAVTLRSLVESQPDPRTVHAVIGSFGITDLDQQALRAVADPITLDFVDLDDEIPDDAPTSAHLNRVVYGRCAIFDHLPPETRRAIYLDCDLIVRDDIGFLERFDLGDAPLAAVQAGLVSQGLTQWRELGLSPTTPYFNSGVLVVDLEAWRDRDLGQAVIDFVYEHREVLRWGDQDGFNGVLAGDFAKLPLRWNQETGLRRPTNSAYTFAEESEVEDAIANPAIVHFTGQDKPWNSVDRDPATREWHAICARTGLGDRIPAPRAASPPRPRLLWFRRRAHTALGWIGRR